MSESRFPQDIVDRVTRHRGRRHPFEIFEPKCTALLVVDMQIYLMREGSPSEIPAARTVVPAINRPA